MTTGGRAELGIDLDELRLLVGLSYRDLARRTGCARSTLHDALTGRRFPKLDTVLAIARACGGDTTRWRLRWVAACKRSQLSSSQLSSSQLPSGQLPSGQRLGTAPTMSRQSTSPS